MVLPGDKRWAARFELSELTLITNVPTFYYSVFQKEKYEERGSQFIHMWKIICVIWPDLAYFQCNLWLSIFDFVYWCEPAPAQPCLRLYLHSTLNTHGILPKCTKIYIALKRAVWLARYLFDLLLCPQIRLSSIQWVRKHETGPLFSAAFGDMEEHRMYQNTE
jgi:hypothetical protein